MAYSEVTGIRSYQSMLIGPVNGYIGMKTNQVSVQITPTGCMKLDARGLREAINVLQDRLNAIELDEVPDGKLLTREDCEKAKERTRRNGDR